MSPRGRRGEHRRVERRGARARQPRRVRREVRALQPRLASALPCAMPEAAFYLWAQDADRRRRVRAPPATPSENVTVLPGSYLARERDGANPGAGYDPRSRWSRPATNAPRRSSASSPSPAALTGPRPASAPARASSRAGGALSRAVRRARRRAAYNPAAMTPVGPPAAVRPPHASSRRCGGLPRVVAHAAADRRDQHRHRRGAVDRGPAAVLAPAASPCQLYGFSIAYCVNVARRGTSRDRCRGWRSRSPIGTLIGVVLSIAGQGLLAGTTCIGAAHGLRLEHRHRRSRTASSSACSSTSSTARRARRPRCTRPRRSGTCCRSRRSRRS